MLPRVPSLTLNDKSNLQRTNSTEQCKNVENEPEIPASRAVKNMPKKTIKINSKYTLNTHKFMNSPIFSESAVFKATITFIENIDSLEFYVCSLKCKELIDLAKETNLPILRSLPAQGEIFGICLDDNNVLRVICENHNDQIYLNLIDFGEVLEFEKKFKLLSLPEKFTHIPPQAIKCQLLAVKSANDKIMEDKRYLVEELKAAEYNNVLLKIKRKTAEILYVELLKNAELPEIKEETGKSYKYKGNPFCIEDDEDTAKIQEMSSDTSFSMRVVVTHVVNAVRFYAQTPVKGEQANVVCWSDESVGDSEKLSSLPKEEDLVLAQYTADAFWYRARVLKVLKDINEIKVFFVDFGNVENVALCSLAALSTSQLNHGFRAQLFRLANVEEFVPLDKKNHEILMDAMRVLLVNSELNIKIRHMSANEEAVVDLLDKDLLKSIDELVEEKLLRRTT